MSEEISKVYVSINGSTAGLRGALNSAKMMLGGFASVGRAIALPALAGLAASAYVLKQGLTEAITTASNLGETLDKTRAVLGSSADEAIRFAQGLSAAGKNTVGDTLNSMTGTIMAMRNQGVAKGMAESLAQQLEERKIDIASMFNMDSGQITQDLQSAFAGSTEVLRKYFVYLNADQIKAGGLSAAEAITRAFMRGTEVTRGNFEATKNTLANLTRTTAVMRETAMGAVGQGFYGLGQALEIMKQRFWNWITMLGQTGVLESFGAALQQTVFSVMTMTEAVAQVTGSMGSLGDMLMGLIRGFNDVMIGLSLMVKQPLAMFAFMVMEASIAVIGMIQALTRAVGLGDVLQDTRKQFEAAKQGAANMMAADVAAIDAKIAERVNALKGNIATPFNPLGAPTGLKPGQTSGGQTAYNAALSGAFSRENMALQEAQKQTKLLEKIAGKPDAVGAGVPPNVTKRPEMQQQKPAWAGFGAN